MFRKLLVIAFLLVHGTVFAGEYNVPFWIEDKAQNKHTFISIQNPCHSNVEITITFKNNVSEKVLIEDLILQGGNMFIIDTSGYPITGYGTVNIFVNDSLERKIPLAITALLHGNINTNIQVWRY
jgi:hypothetical protein